jgi:hypothetical protein
MSQKEREHEKQYKQTARLDEEVKQSEKKQYGRKSRQNEGSERKEKVDERIAKRRKAADLKEKLKTFLSLQKAFIVNVNRCHSMYAAYIIVCFLKKQVQHFHIGTYTKAVNVQDYYSEQKSPS